MIYLAKGKNVYPHVKGKNVWYITKDKTNLDDKQLSTSIVEFNKQNDILSYIHGSRLNVVELS